MVHDYTNQEVSFAPLKTKAKVGLFKSFDPSVILLPPEAPKPVVIEYAKTKVLAWPISVGASCGALATIVGAIALIVIYCNYVPEEIEPAVRLLG